jgi:hypothetical protein
MSVEYGEQDWETLANVNVNDGSIDYFSSALNETYSYLLDNLSHEVGHLNDWRYNRFLTRKQKILLLGKIIERIGALNRYKNREAENLKNNNKQLELLYKCIEYFAIINGAYLSQNHVFLANEDKDIIKSVIASTDPEYNPNRLYNLQNKLVINYSKKSIKQFKKYAANIEREEKQ